MKNKKLFVSTTLFLPLLLSASEIPDTTSISLSEVSVTSLYRGSSREKSIKFDATELDHRDKGQTPDHLLSITPGIFSWSDGGVMTGYAYYLLRGMSQERVNVTLDGIPWNEAEDFGCYFSNSPGIMSSLESMEISRGATIMGTGTAGYSGGLSLESVSLKKPEYGELTIGCSGFGGYLISGVYSSGLSESGWAYNLRGTISGTSGYKEHAYNKSVGGSMKVGKSWDTWEIDYFGILGYHRNGQSFYGLSFLPDPSPFSKIPNGNSPSETDNFLTSFQRLQAKGKLSDNLWITTSLFLLSQNGDYRLLTYQVPDKPLMNYRLSYTSPGVHCVLRYYPTRDVSITTGVSGYYYSRKHLGYSLPDEIIFHFRPSEDPVYENSGRKPDINVFLRGTWVLKSLELSGGLQYRYTSLRYIPKFNSLYPEDASNRFFSWGFVNASLGVSRKIGRNFKYNLSWTTVGREPSRTDIFGGEYWSGDILIPERTNERVHDLETGLYYNSPKFSAGVNLYYLLGKGELVASGELSELSGLPLHTPISGQRYGVELSASWKLLNELRATGNLSLSGSSRRYTFSPAVISWTELSWARGKLEISGDLKYVSRMYPDLQDSRKLPNFISLGVTGTLKIKENILISGRIENITNHKNSVSGYIGEDGVLYYLPSNPLLGSIILKINLK